MKEKDDVEVQQRPSTRAKRLALLRAVMVRYKDMSAGMQRQAVVEQMQVWEINEHTQRDYMRTLGLR